MHSYIHTCIHTCMCGIVYHYPMYGDRPLIGRCNLFYDLYIPAHRLSYIHIGYKLEEITRT